MSFPNLHITDGILKIEVQRHMITLSAEEFGKMLGLPHEEMIIKPEGDKVNKYNNITVASYIMKEPSSSTPHHFTVGYIPPERCMTH